MKKIIGILRLIGLSSIMLFIVLNYLKPDSVMANIFMYLALIVFSIVFLYWFYQFILWFNNSYIKAYLKS